MLKWYEETKQQHDVFAAGRIRLVRNLSHCPFPAKLSAEESRKLIVKMQEELSGVGSIDGKEFSFLNLEKVRKEEKEVMREKRIINRTIVEKTEPAGLMLSEDESTGIVLNGDDHLRMQCYSNDGNLEQLWEKTNLLDDYVNQHFAYAFHEKYGYLTTFPTNVGTGMRASIILHLPLLSKSKQFRTLVGELGRFGITMKNVYGEGNENHGSLYEISNQKTLGQSEEDIIALVNKMAGQLANSERRLKSIALRTHRTEMEDEAYKSYGVLKYARKLTMKEAMTYLSHIRVGIQEGLLTPGKPINVFGLMMNVQPGSIRENFGVTDERENLDVVRATYVREKLPELI